MDAKRAAVHSGKYFAVTTLFALVGLGFVTVGAMMSEPAIDTDTPSAFVSAIVPGLVVAAVGVMVYRFGKSWALYKTLTSAHEEALEDAFDTEHVKSDIVSVLDDRIADMQTDLQSVNRELRKLRDDDQFDFGNADFDGGDGDSGSDDAPSGSASSAGEPAGESEVGGAGN